MYINSFLYFRLTFQSFIFKNYMDYLFWKLKCAVIILTVSNENMGYQGVHNSKYINGPDV